MELALIIFMIVFVVQSIGYALLLRRNGKLMDQITAFDIEAVKIHADGFDTGYSMASNNRALILDQYHKFYRNTED